MSKVQVPPEKKRWYQPDDWVVDGWDGFNQEAKDWYTKFAKAFYWGDNTALQELCDNAGCTSEDVERLKAEITYELNFHQRQQYTVPKSNKPRYTEWDYGWKSKGDPGVKSRIHLDYYGETVDPEFFAPTKRRRRT